MDNDVYGHVNNVTYYSYFDTVANHFLIHEGGLDIHTAPVIGLVVESKCAYLAPVAYPDDLRAGLRVDRLTNRSVTYGVAIFTATGEDAVAYGHFVHVFVERQRRQAVPIPDRIRSALTALVVSQEPG
ncbi:acyl-CoA thioesterase [Mycobacterium sp. 4D054]|uniref:acyl-CoA thioesterase n=1 Tax=unclassified Mycobacterium TaxID=2642494 RepID=UPI0021B3F14D|nr:thioesterase family protein [Mycobacterium sp. SMC-8]UXA15196.1 acyl-CoA thioesterase [Mycobacterium sp. SMC-8]